MYAVLLFLFLVARDDTQLTDELRHMPELLMDNSAMTPLHNQQENLSLDLPLPALLRRLDYTSYFEYPRS